MDPLDAAVLGAGGATLAHLAMPAPEDTRKALISSSVSALVHLLILGAIAAVGYFAPKVVEEIIPVSIISEPIELPGSNDPAPAPVPKMLSARPATAAALAAAPSVLAAVPAAALQAPNLDAATPTRIETAQVTSQPIIAQAAASALPSAANISDVKPLDFDPAELKAPTVDLSGPSAAAAPTATNLAAPQAFASIGQRSTAPIAGTAAVNAIPAASAAEIAGPAVATEVSDQYMQGGGGYEGGNPSGVEGTVPCMQSAYVMRYKDEIERRTRARWVVPMNAKPEDQVTVSFKLDHAGAITRVKLVSTTSDEYGRSALEALHQASPFPPLDDNVRCLSEKQKLKLTFTNN